MFHKYSAVKYKDKEEQDKPQCVNWYMLLLKPHSLDVRQVNTEFRLTYDK